jgi:hypothetical protein
VFLPSSSEDGVLEVRLYINILLFSVFLCSYENLRHNGCPIHLYYSSLLLHTSFPGSEVERTPVGFTSSCESQPPGSSIAGHIITPYCKMAPGFVMIFRSDRNTKRSVYFVRTQETVVLPFFLRRLTTTLLFRYCE